MFIFNFKSGYKENYLALTSLKISSQISSARGSLYGENQKIGVILIATNNLKRNFKVV